MNSTVLTEMNLTYISKHTTKALESELAKSFQSLEDMAKMLRIGREMFETDGNYHMNLCDCTIICVKGEE